MNADPSPPPDLGDFARRLLALEADPSFQALQSLQNRTSFFRIVGTTETERWHSAFWSWMLDPDGSHGLGDFAVRRLLMRACDESGRLRAAPIWRPTDAPPTTPPSMSDLLRWRITESAAAPGPLTGFSEVTSRRVLAAINGSDTATAGLDPAKKRGTSGDASRFDILLCVQGDHPAIGANPALAKGAQLTLVVVVEVKVGAPYDAGQLRRYSKWLHENPRSADLVVNDAMQPFKNRLEVIEGQADASGDLGPSNAEAWGVGLFLAKDTPARSPTPLQLEPAWSPVEFGDLLTDILEPALKQSQLIADARPLIENYISLIADPSMEILRMAPTEHRELVLSLYRRHKATFGIIRQVLEQPSTEGAAAPEIARALKEVDEDEAAVVRASSLTPGALVDAGLAKIGDVLVHRPMKSRATGQFPFTGDLEVRLVSVDRRGFQLVAGPAEMVAKLGDALYTSTGLLTTAYQAVGGRFSGSGNAALEFRDGEYAGKSLEQVYGQARG